jgi:AcrR family transcriptional regulator
MAARTKTTRDKIVAAARAIIAERGEPALSLHLVAAAVGVKAPSLYKRFSDRAALVAAVRDALFHELAALLGACAAGATPREALPAMGHAFRGFAKRQGRLYPLLFTPGDPPSAAAVAVLAPAMATLATLLTPARVLAATRSYAAFLHGFVSLELSDSFQMAGSVDDAFAVGLAALTDGVLAMRSK